MRVILTTPDTPTRNVKVRRHVKGGLLIVYNTHGKKPVPPDYKVRSISATFRFANKRSACREFPSHS